MHLRRLLSRSSLDAVEGRETCLFPPSDIESGAETNTSSDVSTEACEKALNDTPKEAKLHGLAVSSSCVVHWIASHTFR